MQSPCSIQEVRDGSWQHSQKPPLMFLIHWAHGLLDRSWESVHRILRGPRLRHLGTGVAAQERETLEDLRASAEEIKGLGLEEIVDHYGAEITLPPRSRPF